MKYKAELVFTLFFAIFFGFFTAYYDGDKVSLVILAIFFLYIPALCIIEVFKRLMKKSKGELIENFNRNPLIVRILIFLFVISSIFELIMFRMISMSYIILLVLFFVSIWYWLHKEEE